MAGWAVFAETVNGVVLPDIFSPVYAVKADAEAHLKVMNEHLQAAESVPFIGPLVTALREVGRPVVREVPT